jgi:hypothetical protein
VDKQVADKEDVVNFVLESNKFKGDDIDHRAFLPGPDGERSVFRVDELTNGDIATIGIVEVGTPRGKPILGWARISAKKVREAKPLQIEGDEPPERHAIIFNWPEASAKEQRRALAMILASDSCGVRWGGPNQSS